MKKYKTEFNISFPLLIDEGAKVADSYGVQSHPQTFFINREGKIVGRALKEMDWTSRSIRNLIQHLIKGGK